jgi:hypothetical protein
MRTHVAMNKTFIRPKFEFLWFSTVDQGKRLELRSEIDGAHHELLTIVADEQDESLWLEMLVENKLVQVPLAAVQAALADAHGNVHSEAWHEANGHYDSGATTTEQAE